MKLLSKIIIICLITLGIHFVSHISGAIPFFDFRLFDLLSQNREAPFDHKSNATVVVEIDESSLKQFGQWPWPRILLAKAIEKVFSQHPAAVGLDIFFPEPDRTSPQQISSFYQQMLGLEVPLNDFPQNLLDHDLILAHTLKSGPIVLPLFASAKGLKNNHCNLATESTLSLPDGFHLPQVQNLICNTPVLQEAAQGFGYINAAVDIDGIFRRQPLIMNYKGAAIPNLALAMLHQIDPELHVNAPDDSGSSATVSFADRKIPFNRQGEILNLLYPRKAFTKVSMVDLISGAVPDSLLTGKLVLIGATAAGLYDQYMTPGGEVIPGVYVHAALLENIMQDKVLYQPENAKKAAQLLSFFFSLLLVWLVFERRYLMSWIIFLGTAAFALVFSWYQLQQGQYVSIGYFLAPFSFLFFIISLFFSVLHYVERKRFLEDLGDAHSAAIDSMTMVAESRDVETGAHIIRTKEYVKMLAEYLYQNTPQRQYLSQHILELLYRAAPLHDIGKVGIPDIILQKPGPLDERELSVMRSHVGIGRTIIANAINSYNKTNEFLTIASNIAYSHHEKWDGSGYPLGLKGDEIPLEGRLMALADVYDALISRRCYKEPMSFEQAESIILADSGKHFDPAIIAAFIDLKEKFREVAHRYEEGYDINALHLDPKDILDHASSAK